MKNLKVKNSKSTISNYIGTIQSFIMIAVIFLFSLTSCGGDDVIGAATGCGSSNWSSTIESATSKWSETATNYANDPSIANCNKYKSAGLDYVKAYKKILKCIPGSSKTIYKQAFTEIENEIKNLSCN